MIEMTFGVLAYFMLMAAGIGSVVGYFVGRAVTKIVEKSA